MHHIEVYLLLLAIVATVSIVFRKSAVPTSLLLVIVGMLLSLIPEFPHIHINPEIIFNLFLPLLLYEASAYSSNWKELKDNIQPIILLSIGHVIFITLLVAATIHYFIPELGWPLALVLGAVISPPDDVAILAIAEKTAMPNRVVTILKGEAIFNDATALIIYRLALVAALTHEFSAIHSINVFLAIVIGETCYGIALAHVIGELRLRVTEPRLQMLISVLTPFLAYIPASKLGGSGVVATVATGLYIGNFYWHRYTPDVRLAARTIWETLGFAVQSILFLLVGLDFENSIAENASIPLSQLIIYSLSVLTAVIVGRFVWVYATTYLPRLFTRYKPSDALPWQYTFVVAWAGMRGGISLAAALAVPELPIIDGINPRFLLIFLVFLTIVATLLVQGLSLPWILKWIGMPKYDAEEKSIELQQELAARMAMADAVVRWLHQHAEQNKNDQSLIKEIQLRIEQYQSLHDQLNSRLSVDTKHAADSLNTLVFEQRALLSKIVAIEREELSLFWKLNKIDYAIKFKLENQLDLKEKHVDGLT